MLNSSQRVVLHWDTADNETAVSIWESVHDSLMQSTGSFLKPFQNVTFFQFGYSETQLHLVFVTYFCISLGQVKHSTCLDCDGNNAHLQQI